MPTLSEIRQTVNNWLAVRWPVLVDRQEQYFASREHYFQGLWTHSAAPIDGAETSPDRLAASPTDQAARWPDFITLPDLLPCALRLDVYESEEGHGWIAVLRIQVAGTIYERQAQVGPDETRTSDWQPVADATEPAVLGAAPTRSKRKRKS
jgi:hypothetical protein